MADFAFICAAALCLVSAASIVTRKNPVYSVVWMLPFFLGMVILFVLLQAPFLAAMQMMVYGGAILVVFLFVIMLINQRPEELRDDLDPLGYLIPVILCGCLGGMLLRFGIAGSQWGTSYEDSFARPVPATGGETFGSIENLSLPLFREFVVPFELASILIVVALLGAVILAKKSMGRES